MNQPKFKIGDKVCANPSHPFIVRFIQWSEDDQKYYYKQNDNGAWLGECLLNLYQEPTRKKLYAYSRVLAENAEKIEFFKEDAPFQYVSHGTYKRSPDYDIEYEEK